jgi:hypothetical protein
MKVAATIYEKPSRLSQGLVVVLSVAVVLMSGWLAVTILLPSGAATNDDVDATASTQAAVPASSARDEATVSGASVPQRTARSSSAHFDWPEEFNAAPAPPPTALPVAPAGLPADASRSPWPTTVAVPDTTGRGVPARQPPAQAGAAAATDAIVDILIPPPSGAKEAAAAAVPMPRPVPPRRQKPRTESETAQASQEPTTFEAPSSGLR